MQTQKLNFFSLLLFVFIFANTFSAHSAPTVTTYQAKIVKPDGYPLEASNVNFKFTILDPAGSCILYAETYSAVNMNSTGGLVSFSLGSGVKTYPASATTFENVFSNITPNLSCDAGGPLSYSPASTDIRKIVMQFHDGSGWQTLPAMNINAVPYAMYASNAEKLGGVSATAFTQRSEFATCGAGQALSFNGTSFSCITAGGSGSVSAAAITAALGYTPADPASFTTVTSNISSVSSTVFSVSSTVSSLSNAFTSLSNSVAASFAAIAGSGISTFNGSTSATQSLANGTAGTAPAFVTAAGVHTLNIPYASVGTTTAGLISNSEYSLFSTVVSKITSSAAAIAQVLGYTPADQAVVTTLSSTVSSVSSAANAAQVTANSVSATVDSLSSTVAGKITSSSASIAQVLGYVPAASGGTSSQWVTSGSTINYSGNVGIGTASPQHKLSVSGSAYVNGRLMIGNTPLENGNIDFGPMIGAGTFASSFVQQETITDFSNTSTFGSTHSLILNGTAPSSGTTAGRFNIVQNSASSPANHPLIIGDYNIADNEGTGNITMLNAQSSIAVNNGPGSIVQIVGMNSRAYNANGNVGNMFGGQFGSASLGGTVANNYGVYIDSASGAGVGSNYGLYISDQSTIVASQTYNIYSAGPAANNYFAGAMGLGILLPGARLHVGAGTNVVPGFKLTSSTLTTSPTSGSVEYDGFNLYYTDGTNTRRALATAGSGVTSSSIATALGYVPAASGAGGGSSQWTTSSTAIIFTGGNVGIGTSNPSYVLEVSGASRLAGKVLFSDGAFNNPSIAFANNPGTGFYNASGYLGFSVGSSLVGTLTNSSLGFNAGGAGPQIYFTGGNAAQPSYAFNSDSDTGMYNPGGGGSNELAFSTSGTEKFRITSAGTVGIGTNLPKATLDVRGDFVTGSPGNCWVFNNAVMSHNALAAPTMLTGAEVNCSSINLTLGGQPAFGPASTKIPAQNIQFYTGPASVGYGTERMRLDYNGNLGIGVTNISAKLHIAAGNSTSAPIKLNSGTLTTVAQSGTIEYNGANLYFTDGTSTRRALATVPSNGTYDTTNVNVTNNLNVSGTTRLAPIVGIGTTSPLFGLHVVADNTNGFAAGFQTHATSGGVSLGSVGHWGGAIQSLTAGGLSGSTSINPYGGNVGIGVTSPTATLGLYSAYNINSGSNLANGIGAIRISDGTSIGLLFDSNQIEQMDSSNYLYLNHNSSASTVVNFGGGSMGVGTVPGRLLHIAKASAAEQIIEQTDALTNYKKWNFVVDSGNATTPSRFYIRQLNDAMNGGNVPFTITASGSVGIGTQTPGGKLQVVGTDQMISNGQGATFRLTNTNSANSDYFQVGWISEDNWGIMTADSSTHRNLVVTPWGGNLGVGNVNPTYKLDVSGDIRISGNAYRDGGAAGFTLTSDARLKDVTSGYDRGLKELLDIDTVMFRYKKNTPRNLDTSKEFPGVLAQQVQKVIPEAVDKEKDGFLSLNTTPIFWAMINAIKEVYNEVMGIKAENAQLKAQAEVQARKISSLEEENAAVKARLERIEKALSEQNKQ